MQSKKPVRQIVREQREAQGPEGELPAPFRGWYTRGYLPHYDAPGVIQMVTWRLADALPASRRHEWESLLAIEDERERRTRLEAYLDLGFGTCHLRDARAAEIVETALLHFEAERYRLAAWMVMPNHVHVLFEMLQVPLPQILHCWKRHTALKLNQLLGLSGPLWQEEYWDRYMRDETHFTKAMHYVEWNPVKARLVRKPEDWPFSSANGKWRWTSDGTHTRYTGAHLIHPNWSHFGARVSNPPGEPKS